MLKGETDGVEAAELPAWPGRVVEDKPGMENIEVGQTGVVGRVQEVKGALQAYPRWRFDLQYWLACLRSIYSPGSHPNIRACQYVRQFLTILAGLKPGFPLKHVLKSS